MQKPGPAGPSRRLPGALPNPACGNRRPRPGGAAVFRPQTLEHYRLVRPSHKVPRRLYPRAWRPAGCRTRKPRLRFAAAIRPEYRRCKRYGLRSRSARRALRKPRPEALCPISSRSVPGAGSSRSAHPRRPAGPPGGSRIPRERRPLFARSLSRSRRELSCPPDRRAPCRCRSPRPRYLSTSCAVRLYRQPATRFSTGRTVL